MPLSEDRPRGRRGVSCIFFCFACGYRNGVVFAQVLLLCRRCLRETARSGRLDNMRSRGLFLLAGWEAPRGGGGAFMACLDSSYLLPKVTNKDFAIPDRSSTKCVFPNSFTTTRHYLGMQRRTQGSNASCAFANVCERKLFGTC